MANYHHHHRMKINLIKLVLKLMQLNKHRTSESIIIKIKFIKAT